MQLTFTYTTNSPQESYPFQGTWQMSLDENSGLPVSSSLHVGTDSLSRLVEVDIQAAVDPDGGYIVNFNTTVVPEPSTALMFMLGSLVLCSRSRLRSWPRIRCT